MLVIMSAAYVGAELEAEIGKIVPCMLPIGNKKLLELQVQAVRERLPDEAIVLALPESYELRIDEQTLVDQLNVRVCAVPDGFEFAAGLLYVLNIECGKDVGTIRVLQGHTLIVDLPTGSDLIAVANRPRLYEWHTEQEQDGVDAVWTGYFCFADLSTLIKSLALSRGKFGKAVQRYRKVRPLASQWVSSWYDCGYINTFFNTRATITTQRAFNSLLIEAGLVTKTSENDHKICAEAMWYTKLAPTLKQFTPQLIDHGTNEAGQAFYRLEYLPLLPLNELLVHGRNALSFWTYIFELLEDYLTLSADSQTLTDAQKQAIQAGSDKLYRDKTLKRLAQFSADTGTDLHVPMRYQGRAVGSIAEICDDCITRALALPYSYATLHGDLCFSNILFDARGQRIKVLDPRGTDVDGNITHLGDQSYDMAKIAHSVIGLYDFIIAGRYQLDQQLTDTGCDVAINFELDPTTRALQNAFMQQYFRQYDKIALMPAVVLLFLSMLPLHSDRPDRQQAMLVNAVRLYADYVI